MACVSITSKIGGKGRALNAFRRARTLIIVSKKPIDFLHKLLYQIGMCRLNGMLYS